LRRYATKAAHRAAFSFAVIPDAAQPQSDRVCGIANANAMNGVSQSILILLSLEQQLGLTRRIIASL